VCFASETCSHSLYALMVSLHLKAPSDGEIGNEEADAERRKLWLDDMGALVQRVLGGGEPRLWLITDLSSLEVPADIQADCFVDLLQNMMRNAKQNGEDGHGMIFLAFLSFTKGTLSLLVLHWSNPGKDLLIGAVTLLS
jgi:hypothetical protein